MEPLAALSLLHDFGAIGRHPHHLRVPADRAGDARNKSFVSGHKGYGVRADSTMPASPSNALPAARG